MSKKKKTKKVAKVSLKTRLKKIPVIHFFQGILWALVLIAIPGNTIHEAIASPQALKVRGLSVDIASFPIPQSFNTAPVPTISAQSAIVFEPESGTVVWGKDIDRTLYPASTTKLITALTALDIYSPDQILTVKDTNQVVGSVIHLKNGEQFTFQDLLKALFLPSANDAALVLAENHPRGYDGFMEDMGKKIQTLHLTHTHFTNVSGIDSNDHVTSVHDLALVAKAIVQNPMILDITSQKTASISSLSGHIYNLENTNILLGQVPGLKGLKTGWTDVAGECLVTYTERDNRKLITVVLDSQNRFADSKALIEWAMGNYSW